MRGRALGVLSASALAVGGMVALAGPASAVTLNCGDTVTSSVTLSNDLGPCTGNGLVIGASGITLNLGGHTITGSNTTNTTSNEQVGILIQGMRNVIVQNGTVTGFDAGVAITKGSKNQVINVTAHDNINHSSLVNAPGAATNHCNFGDGIVVTGSNNNIIKNNTAFHNGPFDGIAMVGNSDNNIVSGNKVYDQTVSNELPPAGSGNNGPCGPFSATPTGAGRLHQDIGIRVEGPGANNNTVVANIVSDNQLNGISIHGYVCLNGGGANPPPNFPPRGEPNTGNLIQTNTVRGNGFPDGLDGIGILSQGPLGTVTCGSNNNTIIGNTSIGNAGSGIYVTRTGDNAITSSNTVSQNIVKNNVRDGIQLQGPNMVCPLLAPRDPNTRACLAPLEARNGSNNNTLISNKGTGNAVDDGFDGNPQCDQNFWQQNIFGTVNQACVAAHNGTGTVTGPIPVFP
ncbi:MAG: right-handed parallel beta-helix repeat-containing protein [Acidimicrobiales bacterium]